MPRKYPLLTVSLPVGSDPKQVRANFAAVAKQHGYQTDYHKATTHGSPGEFILAITGGEVVVCPFDDTWYSVSLDHLRPLADAREGWAEALVKAIEAARNRGVEEVDDIWDDYDGE